MWVPNPLYVGPDVPKPKSPAVVDTGQDNTILDDRQKRKDARQAARDQKHQDKKDRQKAEDQPDIVTPESPLHLTGIDKYIFEEHKT